MKERQRWSGEEDALLRSYVKQYGPREWHLVSQRMSTPLHRDAKSCLERWKNYLKPGIKKGSLTEEEQRLVIRLQAKHGNKWKKIAAEVPGRTAKRLGKWWEVYKEKQQREEKKENSHHVNAAAGGSRAIDPIEERKYDSILETFAEKLVKERAGPAATAAYLMANGGGFLHHDPLPPPPTPPVVVGPPPLAPAPPTTLLPPWLSTANAIMPPSSSSSTPPSQTTTRPASPSVTLSLSSSATVAASAPLTSNAATQHHHHHHNPWLNPSSAPTQPETTTNTSQHQHQHQHQHLGLITGLTPPMLVANGIPPPPPPPPPPPVTTATAVSENNALFIAELADCCRDLEEGHRAWVAHKKEAAWRLKRVELQLESEKASRKREKMDEIEAKINALRDEQRLALDRIEAEYREQLAGLVRDADAKEHKLADQWANKHLRLSNFLDQIGCRIPEPNNGH